jgi:hypothetical protein
MYSKGQKMMDNTPHLLKKLPPLLVSATLAFTFCTCFMAGSASASERPKYEAFSTELKRAVSNMNVTFEASSQTLTIALNQMIGNEIYRGSTKTSGLTADIVRNGPITLTAADNCLYFTVPVIMSLSYGGFQTPAVSSKLKFQLIPKITPDWKLNVQISYMGLSDMFAEDTGIGLLSVKPRSIIEGMTQPLQKAMSELISRKINEKYSLKTEMEKVWIAAQKPVLLDKNYRTWLKITPQEVMLYPLCAAHDQVKLSLGLRSFAEVVIGPEPVPPAPVPLPDLKLGTNADQSFRVALNTDIFYKDILNISAPLLLNKELGSNGKSIILKKLDIYSIGDKLAVKVEAEGSYNGIFSLTCKPSFNPQTNVFSVEDVDFDMETQSFLLKSASWLLHSRIRSIIQENINMNLTQRMQQVREMAQKAMDQVKLTDHIFLEGRVKDVKLHDVLVRKDKISIQVYAEGETTIRFQ